MTNLSTLESLGIIIGGLCGVGGLVLGILNAYTQHAQAKPRIVVRPGVKRMLGERHDGKVDDLGLHVLIEIHNVGNVPVQGSLVGFDGQPSRFRYGRKHRKSFWIKNPTAVDGGSWPRRLDPWNSCIVQTLFDKIVELEQDQGFKFARRAWVTTQVGDVFYSTRKDMRTFIRALREAAATEVRKSK